jgi:hypothetical protein
MFMLLSSISSSPVFSTGFYWFFLVSSTRTSERSENTSKKAVQDLPAVSF